MQSDLRSLETSIKGFEEESKNAEVKILEELEVFKCICTHTHTHTHTHTQYLCIHTHTWRSADSGRAAGQDGAQEAIEQNLIYSIFCKLYILYLHNIFAGCDEDDGADEAMNHNLTSRWVLNIESRVPES